MTTSYTMHQSLVVATSTVHRSFYSVVRRHDADWVGMAEDPAINTGNLLVVSNNRTIDAFRRFIDVAIKTKVADMEQWVSRPC